LLAGCGSAPVQPPAELTEIQPTATLKILWQGSVGSAEKSTFFPQVLGNVIYAVGADGSVTGFDKASGRPTVSFNADERVSGGAGVGGGLVVDRAAGGADRAGHRGLSGGAHVGGIELLQRGERAVVVGQRVEGGAGVMEE